MAGLSDLVQKAVYLGVGLASFAAEKAGTTLQELRTQAQKIADEMVERGEMTAEEARKYVDELVKQAQQQTVAQSSDNQPKEPRRIEIIDDEEPNSSTANHADTLRQQVQSLQEELRKLKNE